MDDFAAKPGVPNKFGVVGNEKNSIEPKKRMLSSMTPTILIKHNQPVLVIGSPGDHDFCINISSHGQYL